MRKTYPRGPKKQLTPEWKAAVRARLSELGQDHRWLERQIKAGRGMVTRMLSDEQNTSALVDRVCEVLNVPKPMSEVESPEELVLVEAWRRMTPEGRAHLLGLLGLLPRSSS